MSFLKVIITWLKATLHWCTFFRFWSS